MSAGYARNSGPVGQASSPRSMAGSEGRRVAGEPVAGEGLLHDAAVVMVLLEVQQHQAAVEERADEVAPAAGVGERLVRVAQRDLAGVRSQQHRPGPPDEVVVGHRARTGA